MQVMPLKLQNYIVTPRQAGKLYVQIISLKLQNGMIKPSNIDDRTTLECRYL